jgi:hypothetical protein
MTKGNYNNKQQKYGALILNHFSQGGSRDPNRAQCKIDMIQEKNTPYLRRVSVGASGFEPLALRSTLSVTKGSRSTLSIAKGSDPNRVP